MFVRASAEDPPAEAEAPDASAVEEPAQEIPAAEEPAPAEPVAEEAPAVGMETVETEEPAAPEVPQPTEGAVATPDVPSEVGAPAGAEAPVAEQVSHIWKLVATCLRFYSRACISRIHSCS